ncbi:unnamed protein product [Clavelina lepadiformis]|uniref:PDZ domain-containing protein n=1 Tax=Clavelina lepadiformis TaxID=159417 RepID=A0ABP0G3R5_CLALP
MSDRKKWKNKKTEFPEQCSPPPYEPPPPWIPPKERWNDSNYNNNLITFLPRTVVLERSGDHRLGFNIRGGPAHEYGVYVSKVLAGSEAEKLGLKSGDKILQVNDVDYCDIPHEEAVEILQESDILEMKVKYFPYGYSLQQNRIGMI